MNNISELYGWCSTALRVAAQSLPQFPLQDEPFDWWKHPHKRRLYHYCVSSASPWLAFWHAKFPVSLPLGHWPYIFDLSYGKPEIVAGIPKPSFRITAVVCVQVWCPDCQKFSPQVWDSTLLPIQDAADACVCPHCLRAVWPWLSQSASTSATSRRLNAPVEYPCSNIVPFTNNERTL